jgi:hypothetical protein
LASGFRERPEEMSAFFGRNGVPVPAAWGMMLFVCLLCLVILNARLRAREVVRG